MSFIQGAKDYSKHLQLYLKAQGEQGTAEETLWYKINICPKTLINLKEQTSEFARLKVPSAFYLIKMFWRVWSLT